MVDLGLLGARLLLIAGVGIVVSTLLAVVYLALYDDVDDDGYGKLLLVPFLVPLRVFRVIATSFRDRDGGSPDPVDVRVRLASVAAVAGGVAIATGLLVAPPDPLAWISYLVFLYPVGVVAGVVTTA